jgi:hypothetical protein
MSRARYLYGCFTELLYQLPETGFLQR